MFLTVIQSHWANRGIKLTQHDPQPPWSLISPMVGQSGHCSLASKFSGISWLSLPNSAWTSLTGGWYLLDSGRTPIIWYRELNGKFSPKLRPAFNKKKRIWFHPKIKNCKADLAVVNCNSYYLPCRLLGINKMDELIWKRMNILFGFILAAS